MLVLSEIDLGILPDETIQIQCFSPKNLTLLNGKDAEAIVCSRGTAAALININLPKLKLIQLTSAGFDGVPLEELREKSIMVANAACVYGVPIAETVVFGMLELAKRIHKKPENRRPRLTRGYANYITELNGKTAVILGTGNIGTEIAHRLSGFNMTILGYARHEWAKSEFLDIFTNRETLFEQLGKADYVISTLPENTETRGFVSDEFLRHMKQTAYFINVGRRKTINEDALYRALRKKSIQGAALDMFEKLPFPIINKFRRLSNVIVWPGLTAISKETDERLHKMIVKNLMNLKDGNPESVVNR